MSAANNDRIESGLGRAAIAFTALGAAGLIAFVLVFGRFAGPLVNSLDEELGEVLMERGMRFEASGEVENAKETYLEALERPFHGEHNRADTLKRLGTLYWREGREDAALPYLRDASEFEQPPRSVFEPLVDSLIALNRFDEAEQTLSRWLGLVKEDGTEVAKAKFYEGRLAILRGDRKRAEVAFLEGVRLVPGGRNAAELGTLYFLEHRYEEALPYVNQYLETGSGQRAEYLRSVRERILEKLTLPVTPSDS